MDPKLRTLLRQGERALRLGKIQAAESVYREATEEFPDSTEAWLGLSQAAPSPEEREVCRRRVLELDPAVAPAGSDLNDHEGLSLPGSAEWPENSLDSSMNDVHVWFDEVMSPSRESAPASQPDAPTNTDEGKQVIETQSEVMTCAYHPDVATILRCNRCNKPICLKCAVRTPVGYRCKTCIREQEEKFFSALWYDYVLAVMVSLPLAAIASYIIYSIGWLTIFVAPFAGLVIAEAVRFVTRQRRGRWLPIVVSACIIAGSLPGVALWIVDILLIRSALPLGALFWQAVYLVLAVSSAYYRVK